MFRILVWENHVEKPHSKSIIRTQHGLLVPGVLLLPPGDAWDWSSDEETEPKKGVLFP